MKSLYLSAVVESLICFCLTGPVYAWGNNWGGNSGGFSLPGSYGVNGGTWQSSGSSIGGGLSASSREDRLVIQSAGSDTAIFYNANIDNAYFVAPGNSKLQELSSHLAISQDTTGNNIDSIWLSFKDAYDGYNKGESLGMKWRLMPERVQNGFAQDFDIEQIIDAHGKGICRDWARLACSIFLAKGIPAVIVWGGKSDEGDPGGKVYHEWCEIYYKGTYFITENGEFRKKGEAGYSDTFTTEKYIEDTNRNTYQYKADWFHQYSNVLQNLEFDLSNVRGAVKP